jgi:hypothetical protein
VKLEAALRPKRRRRERIRLLLHRHRGAVANGSISCVLSSMNTCMGPPRYVECFASIEIGRLTVIIRSDEHRLQFLERAALSSN